MGVRNLGSSPGPATNQRVALNKSLHFLRFSIWWIVVVLVYKSPQEPLEQRI